MLVRQAKTSQKECTSTRIPTASLKSTHRKSEVRGHPKPPSKPAQGYSCIGFRVLTLQTGLGLGWEGGGGEYTLIHAHHASSTNLVLLGGGCALDPEPSECTFVGDCTPLQEGLGHVRRWVLTTMAALL
uniref:Uncharacterized protein n=1 Tax=Eutreptiella gymnastica TaxID=73025 RepID=A0A7S1N5C6_9EUGL